MEGWEEVRWEMLQGCYESRRRPWIFSTYGFYSFYTSFLESDDGSCWLEHIVVKTVLALSAIVE